MAQVDYFLKIDGIDGESKDSKHANEIEIHSWSWSESQTGVKSGTKGGTGSGGGGAGKVDMHDFHFTMTVNKASPKLLLACATGDHIKSAVLTCRKAGKDQQEYLVYKFTDLLVSSYVTGGSEGQIVPIDSIAFNFTKLEVEYKPQGPDGKLAGGVKAGYDTSTNKPV